MPSTASQVDIYNMVLDLLEEKPITSTSDGQPATNWLNRNYATARDAELRKHPWNFAITRTSVAADGTDPAFGWDKAYTLPSGWLAMLPLRESGEFAGAHVPYVVEGQKILTDATSPLKFRYVQQITNEGLFDPLFVEALVAKLAFKMAHWLTGKTSYADRALQIYRDALTQARLSDAIESDMEPVDANDVVAIRST